MGFKKKKYKEAKKEIQSNLNKGFLTEQDYMKIYKVAIEKEEYEIACAIDDILFLLDYDVKWCIDHIDCLK
jgi:hypothetical protein